MKETERKGTNDDGKGKGRKEGATEYWSAPYISAAQQNPRQLAAHGARVSGSARKEGQKGRNIK